MMADEIEEAVKIGRKLANYRLIDGSSGNLSIRKGELITITKTGVSLDEIDGESFITLKLGERSEEASTDLVVHEAIYKTTDFKAILHCHGIFNVILSLDSEEIIPIDFEGKVFIGRVRVLEGEFGSQALAKAIAEEVKERSIAVVRAHGIYVAGENLSDVFRKASYFEHSCEILYRKRLIDLLSKNINKK
jgi:L-fuculose-phosphate aldolase